MSFDRIERVIHSIRRLLAQGRREEVVQLIEALMPADQAEVFGELPLGEQEQLLGEVEVQDAADILEELDEEDAAALAETLDAASLTQILDEMEPDEAADLLGDLDPPRQRLALAQMTTAEDVRPLLRYPDDSAGGLMTSDFNAFPEGARIGQVFRSIREQPARGEEIPYVYAVDDESRLVGIAQLADLIRAHPAQPLSAIARTDVVSIDAWEDQEVAARILERYDFTALPVLDAQSRLVGVITADDAMATLEEEATEDIYKSAGILAGGEGQAAKSDLLVRGPVWRVWAVRIPFLMIMLVGGLLAGAIVGAYEASLEAVVALAFFIPVVMNLGGSAGVQSTAIFIRGHALGQIDTREFYSHLLREMLVGLGMGAILGVLAGLVAFLWQGVAEIGLAVGLSLACTMTVAASLGFLIPFLLVKLGLDPAAGSSPFITTLKDISGLLIYFAFATLFLGHLF